MAVGLKVKYYWYQIGNGDFLYSFFSTICFRLENKQWGSKYPYLMNELYQGELKRDHIENAIKELTRVKKELKKFRPSEVVWDIDDLKAKPPWGDNISTEIKNLSEYFVTSEGEDLIDMMEKALMRAKDLNESLHIDTL
jgi:hypothetical protein